MTKIIDLTGKRFGRWVVIGLSPKRDKYRRTYWICRCDCGVEKVVLGVHLKRGGSKSCGCYCREKTSKTNKIEFGRERKNGGSEL